MTTISIDTYALINALKEAGATEQLARVQVETITKIVDVAREQTKHDFKLDDITTNKDLDARIKETELKIELVRRDIKELELSLIAKMAEFKSDTVKDVTKWVATIIVSQTAAVLGILKLLGKI